MKNEEIEAHHQQVIKDQEASVQKYQSHLDKI